MQLDLRDDGAEIQNQCAATHCHPRPATPLRAAPRTAPTPGPPAARCGLYPQPASSLASPETLSPRACRLVELTGGRTVPRVFVDRVFLGGGDDMARLAASGELADLLTSKGLVAQA